MNFLISKATEEVYTIPTGFEVSNSLPVNNWLVKLDPKGQYYLKKMDSYKLPDKLYGDIDNQAKKFIDVFNKGTKNLGILLQGFKGSGKSLLAKRICIDSNLPVLIITEGFQGPLFIEFLSSIKTDCVIFMDEFEKMYYTDDKSHKDSQDSLLSLFDGSISSGKKLFLLTANEGRINSALINRAGRVRYTINYSGLSKEVVEEVINDKLKTSSKKEEIKDGVKQLGLISMDSLIAIIEEVDMFPEKDTYELLNSLNISPGYEESFYEVTWSLPSKSFSSFSRSQGKEESTPYKSFITSHPLSNPILWIPGYEDSLRDSGIKPIRASKTESENPIVKGSEDPISFRDQAEIRISNCKYFFEGSTLILIYNNTRFKFTPISEYKFKFSKTESYEESNFNERNPG